MIINKVRYLISRNIPKIARISVRHHNFDGEAVVKSNMEMVTLDDESHTYIQAFSKIGFKLTSGISILGPCALFPRAAVQWTVTSADKITPESLILFTLLEPKLNILVIGKGDWNAKIDNSIVKYLRSHKINVEILPTEQACSTFNFLNSERRVVAAALIPPRELSSPLDEEHNKLLLDLKEFEDAVSIEDVVNSEVKKRAEYIEEHGYYLANQKFNPETEQLLEQKRKEERLLLKEEEKRLKEEADKKKPD